ncbi:GntR family transcriptional regulator [Bordetella parapertussis]|uniref:GntR-family transcriptional regulator n=5 Tax=Bordetella TaxID=517 RepID=A0A0H3LVC4_BORBR|nr:MULTISPECIES: GntR family transcriptional regulator [Bordetella]KAK64833.1 FCD domain protein [Bordetella bronchiseptica 980-2]KCV32453.1 FCD domain protein [Bordetella bronchiseptica 00-P-2730]KDD58600.1 FCD domain protein [Bordetella bronchiseptica OSU553]SHS07549.1 GntR family transcriptional regulator [Mycobacteroides abscessus subsp. abscessus]AMG88711.1 GntR family transcriptional regulator [Bordetella bronchiseptica]
MPALTHPDPLVHTSVNEAIYRRLRDHLMRGDYAAGAVLGIQELADAFGTSAMPVREALRRLVTQRALEPMKSRSVRVPVISRASLEDIRRARVLIEGHVTAWAVEHITAPELAELRALADQIGRSLSDTASVQAGLENNQRFHFTIYRAARSDSMLATIESLWLQSGPYLRATRELMHSDERPSAELHAAIVDAIARRDAESARAVMAQDISWAFDRLQALQPAMP